MACRRVALLLASWLVACSSGEPVLEIRRAARATDVKALSEAQRASLGCDPCIELERGPDASGALALIGPAAPDLELSMAALEAVEIREWSGLHSSKTRVYDFVLRPLEPAHARLREFAFAHPAARVAISLRGRVIGLSSPAAWPEYVHVHRFRTRERAEALAAEVGLPAEFHPFDAEVLERRRSGPLESAQKRRGSGEERDE